MIYSLIFLKDNLHVVRWRIITIVYTTFWNGHSSQHDCLRHFIYPLLCRIVCCKLFNLLRHSNSDSWLVIAMAYTLWLGNFLSTVVRYLATLRLLYLREFWLKFFDKITLKTYKFQMVFSWNLDGSNLRMFHPLVLDGLQREYISSWENSITWS